MFMVLQINEGVKSKEDISVLVHLLNQKRHSLFRKFRDEWKQNLPNVNNTTFIYTVNITFSLGLNALLGIKLPDVIV